MKRNRPPYRPVALAALIVAAAAPLNSVFAQDAAPTVQAPPVAVPAPTPPAPEAAVPTPAPVFAPKQEIAQPTPPRAAAPAPVEVESAATDTPAPRAERAPARRAAAVPAAPRARQAARAAAPVAVAAAPVTQTSPAEALEQSAQVPSAPTVADADGALPGETPVAVPDVAPTSEDAVLVETPSTSVGPMLWIALAVGLIAILAGFIMRKRRRGRNALVYDTVAYEPGTVAAPAPVAATPIDLQERPWIRLALQPVGSAMENGARVIEYDLIVENEGKVPANDVRVSSFLTGARSSSLIDALANGQAQTHHIDVAAGQSVTLYGKVTAPDGSDPRIVADARYLLPNGTDGHLAARFLIDMSAAQPAVEVEDVMERV